MLATIAGAVLCGARGPTAIAQWIVSQDPEVWYWLGYYRKPPKAGAFDKLLKALDCDAFEAVLREWIVGVLPEVTAEELSAVALDGKTLCGTIAGHGRAVQLLTCSINAPVACSRSRPSVKPTKPRPPSPC